MRVRCRTPRTTAKQQRKRQTVEYRIARVKQLGMRRSRYFGRRKTAFQLRLTLALANLLLVLGAAGVAGFGLFAAPDRISPLSPILAPFVALLVIVAQIPTHRLIRPMCDFSQPAFRPDLWHRRDCGHFPAMTSSSGGKRLSGRLLKQRRAGRGNYTARRRDRLEDSLDSTE